MLWEKEEYQRNSKDQLLNKQGERMLETIGKYGYALLNRNKEGDEQGNWTFNGAMGRSVIDYALCNSETWKEIKEFKIGGKTESDHLPLEITLEK